MGGHAPVRTVARASSSSRKSFRKSGSWEKLGYLGLLVAADSQNSPPSDSCRPISSHCLAGYASHFPDRFWEPSCVNVQSLRAEQSSKTTETLVLLVSRASGRAPPPPPPTLRGCFIWQKWRLPWTARCLLASCMFPLRPHFSSLAWLLRRPRAGCFSSSHSQNRASAGRREGTARPLIHCTASTSWAPALQGSTRREHEAERGGLAGWELRAVFLTAVAAPPPK